MLPPRSIDQFLIGLRGQGRTLLERAQARVRERGIAVETVLQETRGHSVAELIIQQAKKWRADIIVLGTHGRRGLARVIMGSDAEMVVRASPVPVLLVRSPVRAAKRHARRTA